MRDRRFRPRTGTLRQGVVAGSRLPALPCKVRDLTATGARLALAAARPLPDEFVLTLGSTRERHVCRVAWQRDRDVGVRFVVAQVGDLAGSPPPESTA